MTELIVLNKNAVVLLPFSTPHPHFKMPWSVFHPAAQIYPQNTKVTTINENTDYIGYSSVKIASTLSHTIVATIPPKSTLVGQMLDQLLSTFVNPENILAEVERVECEDPTIAGQVKAAFDTYAHAQSVLVIWPYQVFPSVESELLAVAGAAAFAYTHPMKNFNRNLVPECIAVSAKGGEDRNGVEIECQDVAEYAELDTLLKGHYTRVISMVELDRSEFFDFTSSPTYPNLTLLIKKTLAGKRGVMVSPGEHQFI